MISILILTKNEAKDLPGCLDSVKWSDDVHVYDSISTDETVKIAKEFGAHITSRPFDNWSSHQNWGLNNIKFKYPWVFYIDADERMSPELIDSVQASVKNSGSNVAFRVRRRDFWGERWLKHVQASEYYIRLFRPEYIRYERLVNPLTIVDGECSTTGGYLNHYPFSKGVVHWLDRHNSYSTFEAKQIIENREKNQKFSIISAFLERDFNKRRYHQKELFFRMPARPFIKFVLFYVIRGGFLDGRRGFDYAVLQSFYEFMIVLKTKEMMSKFK